MRGIETFSEEAVLRLKLEHPTGRSDRPSGMPANRADLADFHGSQQAAGPRGPPARAPVFIVANRARPSCTVAPGAAKVFMSAGSRSVQLQKLAPTCGLNTLGEALAIASRTMDPADRASRRSHAAEGPGAIQRMLGN